MNKNCSYINQRLSLRRPLGEALEMVEHLTDRLSMQKPQSDNKAAFLQEELRKVQEVRPQCTAFERDFPSLSFSIATGIGKTRLMAACIAYLYLQKGIRHFFILAPNLPIYEKLNKDFGDPSYSKYVFKGIAEFVAHQPYIINGETYLQQGNRLVFDKDEIEINIFNIAKFNTDNKESKKKGVKIAPKMKRMSEYLGQSYYEYLAGLDDLVVLMDEAHRYHADASKNAINELKPVLGLEMTATPFDENGRAFRNIVYEYNLAQALRDGLYVKNPTVASRKNFQKGNLTDDELDILKLEDAISIHEQTKVHLELYAKRNDVAMVKPFILVICKNISHAIATEERMQSEDFFGGQYKGKVLRIDSTTKKDEEVEALFMSLDSTDNEIEVVIHVNMLKEGWDVSNLYTIVPLRAADAPILVEQSIGRGLRLPYGGRRTGDDEVDKLTVIAHENFKSVIDAARDPNSVLNRLSYVEYDPEEKQEKSTVVTASTQQDQKYEQQKRQVHSEEEKKAVDTSISAQKAVWSVLPKMNVKVSAQKELANEENIQKVKAAAVEYIRRQADASTDLFAKQEAEEQIAQVDKVIKMVVSDYLQNTIPIPRMTIQQGDTQVVYNDFDLDTTKGFNLPYLQEEIIRIGLVDNSYETLQAKSSGAFGAPVEQIVSELINYDEIDYDQCSELLFKLSSQAVDAVSKGLRPTDNLSSVIHQFKTILAQRIYGQVRAHISLISEGFAKPKILPFVEILPQHMTEVAGYGRRDYHDEIKPKVDVRKYIFTGFMKSYYVENKFDSSTEQDFAYILENDKSVQKWLRPASNQFNIYWGNGAHKYEPDFIVETDQTIFMIETKKAKEVSDVDVRSKMDSAKEYCKNATEYNQEHGGKTWKYVLLPHDTISRTNSFNFLIASGIS